MLRRPAPAATGPLRIGPVPDPEPGAGQVLVEVAACALCRTDLQLCEGDLEAHRLPVVPGHQVVGRIAAVGAGVTDRSVGERVGVTWLAGSCGRCRFCASGRENLCRDATFTGWDVDGGLAERVVAGADVVHPLPEGPSDAELAPLLCAGVIGYRSLRVAGVGPGDRLGLFGFGASASIVIQVARHWGCEVFVCTRSEREQEVARELGATWAGGFTDRPPELLDAAVTTAPVGDAVVLALESLDRGGVVAVNAIHLDRIPEFPYGALWWERQIRSVANVTRADAREFLELAAAVPVRARHEERPLAAVGDALVDLAAGRVDGSVVLVP